VKDWKEGGRGADFVSHILPSLARTVPRFTKPISGDTRPPRVTCPKQDMMLAP